MDTMAPNQPPVVGEAQWADDEAAKGGGGRPSVRSANVPRPSQQPILSPVLPMEEPEDIEITSTAAEGRPPSLSLSGKRRSSFSSEISTHSEKRRAVEAASTSLSMPRGPESARTLVSGSPPPQQQPSSFPRRRAGTVEPDPDAASIVTIAGPTTLADLPTELLKAILEYVGGTPNNLRGSTWRDDVLEDHWMALSDPADDMDWSSPSSTTRLKQTMDIACPPGYREFWSYPQAPRPGQPAPFGPAATASLNQTERFQIRPRDFASLARCLRLSRGMFRLTLPLLYGHPELRSHGSLRDFSRSLSSKLRGPFYANAVRKLTVGVSPDEVSSILLEGIVGKCDNLVAVDLIGRFDGKSGDGVGSAEEPVGNARRQAAIPAPGSAMAWSSANGNASTESMMSIGSSSSINTGYGMPQITIPGLPYASAAATMAAANRPPLSPAESHAIALTNAYQAHVQRALEEMRETAAANKQQQQQQQQQALLIAATAQNMSAAQNMEITAAMPSAIVSLGPHVSFRAPVVQPATYSSNSQYFAEATAAARRVVTGVVVNLEDAAVAREREKERERERGRQAERGRGHRRGGSGATHPAPTQPPQPYINNFTSSAYFAAATAAVSAPATRPSLDLPSPASTYHALASAAAAAPALGAQRPIIDSAADYFSVATAAAAAPKAPGQVAIVIAPQPVRPLGSPPPAQSNYNPQQKKSLFRSSSQTRSGSRALSPGSSRPSSPTSFFHLPRAKSPPTSPPIAIPQRQATHYHHSRLGSPPPQQPIPSSVPSGQAMPFVPIATLRARNAVYNPSLYPSRVPHPLLKSVSVAMLPPLLSKDTFKALRFEHLTFPRGASLLVRFSTGEKGVRELEFRGCLLDSRVLWRAAANSGRSLEKFVISGCRVPETDEREFENRAFAFWEPLIGGMIPRGGSGVSKLRSLDLSDPLCGLLKPDDRAVMHILRTLGRTLEFFALDVSSCTRLGLVKAARWSAANLKWGGSGGTRLKGLEIRYQGAPRRRDPASKEIYGSSPPKTMYGPLRIGWDMVGAGKDGDALSQLALILGEVDISEEDSRMIESLPEDEYWKHLQGIVKELGWTVVSVGDAEAGFV